MISLNDRVAVVTGGASGIGRAIAIQLAELGARVGIGDLDEAGGAETVEMITEAGGVAAAYRLDVTELASVETFRAEVRVALGIPTIIVNNAGWDLGMPFITTTPDFWTKVVNINYVGVVSMCHTFLNQMIDEGLGGHVVNIGSDAGRVGSMGEAVYAGAKGGVIAFTKSLAREMARHQINVNCVCPGPTDTKLFYEQPEKVREAVVRAIPFRRLAQPQELAGAVAYLVSEQASYVTGQVLSVSGGLTMSG
jgi:2-hydroxycyclohexanecarboxyl-CoA dehydrogenase